MNNKQSLLNLVARAERGALLPGEAQILRDAVELLDDMATLLEKLSRGSAELASLYVMYEAKTGYHPTDTQEMRVVDAGGEFRTTL